MRAQITVEEFKKTFIKNTSEEDANGCKNWLKRKSKAGYGRVKFRGKTRSAHRVSYIIFVGEIPAGALVCHKCDNPACVNINHLFIGSHRDNTLDMIKKGRNSIVGVKKFSKEKCKEIINFYNENNYTMLYLSKIFGCGHTTVENIIYHTNAYRE